MDDESVRGGEAEEDDEADAEEIERDESEGLR